MRSVKCLFTLFGALVAAQEFPATPEGLEVVSSKLFKGAEISYKEVTKFSVSVDLECLANLYSNRHLFVRPPKAFVLIAATCRYPRLSSPTFEIGTMIKLLISSSGTSVRYYVENYP
jgi:hypothetical protein